MNQKNRQLKISIPESLRNYVARKAEQKKIFKSMIVCRAIVVFKKIEKEIDDGANDVNISKEYWEALQQQFNE